MLVHALAAADSTPLTKTFSSAFGALTKSAYPNVRDFISHEADVTSLLEFYAFINTHADMHHCLVKGRLNKALNGESRQGATTAQDTTQWIVFDVDHLPGVTTAEEFITHLPPEFREASYILQHSSSSGFSDEPELRAHLFFMLTAEVMAPTLKVWMKAVNLGQTFFAAHLRLAEGGCTLKWPVDISVNQNDKLIYIAPPLCLNINDPMPGQRITLVTKQNERVALQIEGLNAEAVRTAELTKVNELRATAGLEKKKFRIDNVDGYSVIKNADQMTLTAPPFEERGFVYFPIGNNRHTYYHPVGKHEFLFSFKDPDLAYPMQVVLPSYYWDCERSLSAANRDGRTIMAFRDGRSDVKYIGAYSDDLQFASFNRIKAREDIADYFTQFKQRAPDVIPTWEFVFDPQRNTRIDPDNNWLNKFVPSAFMAMTPSGQTKIPARIKTLIGHIMNDDTECVDHFINWLAYKIQTRGKCKTAWFFQGTEGTGKGVLYNKILRPLFGHEYCHLKRMDSLLDKFNAELETSLIWVIDEANIEDFKDDGQITEKLKNLIVEDQQVIRAMHTNPYNAQNYTDIILFSNRNLAIKLSESDRRYNIAPRQNRPLLQVMERDAIATLETDLPQFADFLLSMEVDADAAMTPLDNKAKRDLIAVGRNTHDDFLHHLTRGDLLFIMRNVPDNGDIGSFRHRQNAVDILKRWGLAALRSPNALLSIDEITAVYAGVVNPGKSAPQSVRMARMLLLRGHELEQRNDDDPPALNVTWSVNEVALQRWLNSQNSQSPRGPHGQQSSA